MTGIVMLQQKFARILFPAFLYLCLINTFIHARTTEAFETNDCFISFVIDSNNETQVIKQIKNPDPDEQFLLVMDTIACHIACEMNIPMNTITLLLPETIYEGKQFPHLPATVHNKVPGISLEDHSCPYHDISIHQKKIRKQTTAEQQWAGVNPDQAGLTYSIIT
jgi:hypothetical protein